MTQPNTDPLVFYASPGPMTDPGEFVSLFDGLPAGVSDLVKMVQGLLIHVFWAERYGLKLSEERKEQEVNLRGAAQKLKRIQELDTAPLTVERPLEGKLVGNCRDFSVLLCAMLRHQGIPARRGADLPPTSCPTTTRITGCVSIGRRTSDAG